MTGRVLVRRVPWSGVTAWEVLCPCCADRRPGVAVLAALDSWPAAVTFAVAHGWVHR